MASPNDFTPILGLPYLLSNQAQKHVTLNESLRVLDGLLQISVASRIETEPPESPDEGGRYMIAPGSNGAWAGHEGELALFSDGGWLYFQPAAGWQIWVADEGVLIVHDGSGWVSPLPDDLQNIKRLGLNATADASNPLLARLNAALLTAEETGQGGSGDVRLKLNKEASGHVLSLLFQSGYASHAEIGLVGDDDLVLRVSPDGTGFLEGIRIDHQTGVPRFPSGGVREQLTANRTYYVDASSGSDTNDGLTPGAALQTIQFAIDVVLSLDLGIHDVTIELAPGSYAGFEMSGFVTGSGTIWLKGDETDPANCVLDNPSGPSVSLEKGARLDISGVHVTSGNAGFQVLSGGLITIVGPVSFGDTNRALFRGDGIYSEILVKGPIEVTADFRRFFEATRGAHCQMTGETVTFTGTPEIQNAFIQTKRMAMVNFTANTVTGAVTGRKYQAYENSLINLAGGGDASVPGDLAGEVYTGAVIS